MENQILISSNAIIKNELWEQEEVDRHLEYIGQDEPSDELYPLIKCLESNGIENALWCLKCVEGYDREIRLFAAACARVVLPIFEEVYPDDDRPRKAIEAAEAFANGEITWVKMRAASDVALEAAYEAVCYAASYAACSAACSAAGSTAGYTAGYTARDAAGYTARDAVCSAARDAIENEFRLLCALEGRYAR